MGFTVCLYGIGGTFQSIPVCSSSWAGLLAGSECSGIRGLPHVAGVRHENVGNCVYTAQGNLEHITTTMTAASLMVATTTMTEAATTMTKASGGWHWQ